MCRTDRITTNLLESARSSQMNFRHGTIITKGSSVPIFRGCNSSRSKYMNYINYCQHAEMDVARKLHWLLSRKCDNDNQIRRLIRKYIIWVGRVSKMDNMTHSKPCKQCRIRLLRMGFKRIGYTDENGEIHLVNIDSIVADNLSNCQRNLAGAAVSHKNLH